jgi:phospho-N-acetylmuramoyl-pentapeptide-transferase
MGGLIIIFTTLVPVLLLQNCITFILYCLLSTLWMGTIGFIDDYIKILKGQTRFKRNFKVIGQVGLGLIVGTVLYFHQVLLYVQIRLRQIF